MPTPVKMPRLGESVAEGTIGSWLKKEGDWVEQDESLAEIITDKINAELPSPVAGRLAKILVKADETVAVGVDIALIEENADVSVTTSAQAAPVAVSSSASYAPLPHTTTIQRPAAVGADLGAQFIAPSSTPVYVPTPTPTTTAGADVEIITPDRVRLAIAEHMVRSKRTS